MSRRRRGDPFTHAANDRAPTVPMARAPCVHRRVPSARACVAMTATAAIVAGSIAPANARGAFGLYPAEDFRVTDGRCVDCTTHRAALWYFEQEAIAVPRAGH